MIAAVVVLVGLADLILPLVHAKVGLDPVPTSWLIPPISEAIVPAVGLLLVVLGRGLARGHRDALVATVVLVTLSAELEMLTQVDRSVAPLNLFVLAVLLACRRQFTGRGDPARRLRLALWAAIAFGAIVAYGAAALWINSASASQPMTVPFVLAEVGRAMLGLNIAGSAHLAGSFWPGVSALHDRAHGNRERAPGSRVARAMALPPGAGRLGPRSSHCPCPGRRPRRRHALAIHAAPRQVVLRGPGRHRVRRLSGRGRRRRGVGRPVGLPGAEPGVFDQFVEFAHERGWRVAVLGASERLVGHYRSRGFHTLYHGDEALIDVGSFSLDGREIRKVRQSVHRLERAGYTAEVRTAGECDEPLRDEMRGVLSAYLGGGPMRGFTMELDDLFPGSRATGPCS